MGLITRTLPALNNGVSQQPAILRSADQSEEELNSWASMAFGLGKRPPTKMVAKIADTLADTAYIHYINRDTSERYWVIIDAGMIKVFDADGVEKTVNAPGGLGYLTGSNYTAVTVADYTFIVNRSKVCELKALAADTSAQPAYLRWLSNYPDASTTGIFASAGAYGFSGGIYQYLANPSGGTYAGEVATMEKLPETAANGTVYKVTGSADTGFSSFYVRRNGAVWDETVGPGQRNAIDETTMPHALIREANGTFTFAPFSWAPRRAGDLNTNPPPTFCGKTISDVFFYQNRLAFLVDENVIFSCAGDFGNFWRNTVLDYIDSDVIDVAVTSTSVSLLKYAVTFNDGMVLFSDQTQFALSNGESGLTPSSVAIRPITRYTINQTARPVGLSTEVYFAEDQQGKSIVREYTRLDNGTDATSASDITAHVPSYIPAGLKDLVPVGKAVIALTGGNDAYAYQFYWNGNEKILSAWRKWTFGGLVLSGVALDESVHFLVKRNDGVFIETMNLNPNDKPAEQPKQTYLDRRATATGTYNSSTGRTTFTLPYAPIQANFRIVQSNDGAAPHALLDPSGYQWVDATHVSVLGNYAGKVMTIGEAYPFRYVFSRQFPLTPQGEPLTTGRLQLRTMTVNFVDTAFFRTEVQPYGEVLSPDVEEIVPAKLADFTGKVVGAAELKLNTPIYHTGSYSFQIYGDAAQAKIALTNDTHVGSTFVSAEWEGFWSTRA